MTVFKPEFTHFPACICCNSLIQQLLTRRHFLLGTGAFAAAILSGNTPKTLAQTDAIRILEEKDEFQLDTAITVYVARKIITMEDDKPIATAVAVAKDRIIALGSLEDVKTTLGNQKYTIDRRFADQIMLPGLVEEHLHPILGALTMAVEVIAIEDWNVPNKTSKAAKNEQEYTERLKKAINLAKTKDPSQTLFTWGYHHYFHGKMYRPQLDKLSPDYPVAIWHRSCHEFILNTAALKKYGVTEASLKGHGQASSQASWENGHFYEKGMEIIIPFIASDLASPAYLQSGMDILTQYLHSKGITTIAEPATPHSRKLHTFFENSLDREDIPFRTYFIPDGRSLFEKNKQNLSQLIPATQKFQTWGKGKVQWLPKQIKLFADGAIFSQLMQVNDGYLDGHQGEWLAIPEDYATTFKIYWDAGYHIHTHVNGDKGLEVVLNTLADNMKRNPRQNHRFTVVHFAVSTEDQVKQLAKLEAIVSANPYYVTSLADKYSEIGLGAQRANSMVRLGSVVKQDVSISLHSDMPMAPADPLFLAWCAANRTTVSGRTADPSQKITVEKALRAVTIEAAYCIDLEEEIGSIKVGKKADFTVIKQDPLNVSPDQLKDILITATIFEGKVFPINSQVSSQSNLSSGKASDLEVFNQVKSVG